ncbi:hypothetical protein GWI34_26635, partial [Actinomadura sp. DSM 109109]|nr:hypothetical protein [Actinomadura lepetitiana]
PHHDTQARPRDEVRQGGQVRHDGAVRHGGPGRRSEAPETGVSGGVSRVLGGGVREDVSGGVREIGEHPVRYLRARQQDLLDGKDRAVGQVRAVAGEAGVPGMGVADLLQGRPVIGGLVHRVTDQPPLLDDGVTPDVPQGPEARHDDGRPRDEAATTAKARARHAAVRLPATVGGPARESADPCSGCRGADRAPSPGPALPSGQDAPRGGGSAGGHPFAPFADLLHGGHPAAPSAADPGTFRRTALRDVAAPGGPSVVPD